LNDSEMTSEHVRAARMLLRWEQKNLAKRSGVSLPTIKRLEAKPGPLGAYASTLAAIRTAFEDEGIEFFRRGARCATTSQAKAPAAVATGLMRRITDSASLLHG
jgi:transcriptional regulator with XRE-family HTH domain